MKQGAWLGAQRTEHRARSTEHGARSSKHRARCTGPCGNHTQPVAHLCDGKAFFHLNTLLLSLLQLNSGGGEGAGGDLETGGGMIEAAVVIPERLICMKGFHIKSSKDVDQAGPGGLLFPESDLLCFPFGGLPVAELGTEQDIPGRDTI